MELFDVVMKLVGPVQATGSHEQDMKRLANIKELTALTHDLLMEIYTASRDANHHAASMKAIGKHAQEFLKDVRNG